MDATEIYDEAALDPLSYDDNIAQAASSGPPLAERIGRNKVYLLSESSISHASKRKRENDGYDRDSYHSGSDGGSQLKDEVELDMQNGATISRHNALLFHSAPLSHLSTDRIFAYATHYEAQPFGLEWIDDSTCVLVFQSTVDADTAYHLLQKSADEAPDEDGRLSARSIPQALWPPEERISASLGKSGGLRGSIRMRWARPSDVKKRGAYKDSEFYRRYGSSTGKEPTQSSTDLTDRILSDDRRKRRKREEDTIPTKAELDDELDAFLHDVPSEGRQAPPEIGSSKSASELTSHTRNYSVKFPLYAASSARKRTINAGELKNSRAAGTTHRQRRSRQHEGKSSKSLKELDDELDSFLNDRT